MGIILMPPAAKSLNYIVEERSKRILFAEAAKYIICLIYHLSFLEVYKNYTGDAYSEFTWFIS